MTKRQPSAAHLTNAAKRGKTPESVMTPAERKKEFQAAHPVVVKGVSTLLTLSSKMPDDWQKCWDEEMDRLPPRAEILIGLLHYIFKFWIRIEKVCFCLQLADGYREAGLFGDEENATTVRGTDPRTTSWLDWNPRHEVARKAWQMLCEYIFALFLKERSKVDNNSKLQVLVFEPEVFNKILWFFNPERDNIPEPDAPSPNKKLTRDFLREFVRCAWKLGTGGGYPDFDKETNDMCLKTRLQLLEIMAATNDLDWLLTMSTLDLDETIMKRLEELALKRKFLFHDERFLSLEEAVACSHPPAKALVLLRMKRQIEQERAEREESKRRYDRNEQLKQEVQAAQHEVDAAKQRLAELLAVTKK